MLSILVCHSYFLRFDPKQEQRAKPYPPLATLQVAGMLRQAGHQVALFDAMLATGIEEYEIQLTARPPQAVVFYEDTFNFLSKMCLGRMREAACSMIGSARRVGARVIVCGPDVNDAPEPYLRAGADVALLGEGLTTLLRLIPRLDNNTRGAIVELVRGLSGTVTLVNDAVVKVNGTRVLPEPDQAPAVASTFASGPAPAPAAATAQAPAPTDPLAAWDLLDMDRYRAVWMRAHGHFSLNMAASRGCSFRCHWCAKPIWGNQYLQRSAASVAREMLDLKARFRPDHIWFADDIFGFRVDWVNEFAAALDAAGGGVPFTIQTRADLLSERMATALASAGCLEAWLGAESGSQRILDAMNKGTTVAQIVTARARLQAEGIRVGFFIQLGYLDEQLADILATRALLELARPDDVGVSVSYPLPGTKFHELVKEQLRGQTHWQDSADLAMMFKGTYTSEFYRAIRNLIHDQVALQNQKSNVPCEASSLLHRGLERRWHDLLRREKLYRSGPVEIADGLPNYEARVSSATGTVGHRSVD